MALTEAQLAEFHDHGLVVSCGDVGAGDRVRQNL